MHTTGFSPIFRISNTNAVDMMMKRYDTDKNGTLDVDEAQTVPILSRKNFPQADTFGDGKLTKKEFVGYLDKMKLALMQGPSSNPIADMMGGVQVSKRSFDQIQADAGARSGKMQFINYMAHITKEYEAAQQAKKTGIDIKA